MNKISNKKSKKRSFLMVKIKTWIDESITESDDIEGRVSAFVRKWKTRNYRTAQQKKKN